MTRFTNGSATNTAIWIKNPRACWTGNSQDASEDSFCRIALAPCSPFSVTPDLMRATAELAQHKDVLLHTHLGETEDENNFCLKQFGMRPVDYLDDVG